MTIAERLGLGKEVQGPTEEAVYIDAAALMRPKSLFSGDRLLIAILLLSSFGSFGLGLMAGKESGGSGSESKVHIDPPAPKAALPAAAMEAESSPAQAEVPGPTPPSKKAVPKEGGFVASRTGTKYYLPWCGTAKRIKEENKVWFGSKAEAESAGYEPAKNCKGL